MENGSAVACTYMKSVTGEMQSDRGKEIDGGSIH